MVFDKVQFPLFDKSYIDKISKCTKLLIKARLGVSRTIYVNVDSPNLGSPYFNFLGEAQCKKNTLYNGNDDDNDDKIQAARRAVKLPPQRNPTSQFPLPAISLILISVYVSNTSKNISFLIL